MFILGVFVGVVGAIGVQIILSKYDITVKEKKPNTNVDENDTK